MLSRKNKDKTSKTGLAGKYIKKESTNSGIKRKKFRQIISLIQNILWGNELLFPFLVINVWTNEPQRNSKTNARQQTPFEEQPTTSKVKINALGMSQEREDFSQGKYTQNPSTNAINLSHVFGNLHLSEQSNAHQSSVEPMRRISRQSHTPVASFQNAQHQNTHGNYVEIDAIDSILLENENLYHYGAVPQYDRSSIENRMLDVAIASPIYENQTSLVRSQSPIYSNTHTQSLASLYPNTQNIYSNLPAITSGPSNAAYANLPQPHHGVLAPSKYLLSDVNNE